MKEWVKEHKGLTIVLGVCGVSALAGFTYLLGRKHGGAAFSDLLIRTYENAGDKIVVTSTDKKTFGNLMYEISLECIGD